MVNEQCGRAQIALNEKLLENDSLRREMVAQKLTHEQIVNQKKEYIKKVLYEGEEMKRDYQQKIEQESMEKEDCHARCSHYRIQGARLNIEMAIGKEEIERLKRDGALDRLDNERTNMLWEEARERWRLNVISNELLTLRNEELHFDLENEKRVRNSLKMDL